MFSLLILSITSAAPNTEAEEGETANTPENTNDTPTRVLVEVAELINWR